MISLAKDTIDRSDINRLIDWLQQEPIPKLTKGQLTRKLEVKWAKMLGINYSVFVNSGSSAILLSLYSLLLLNRFKNKKVVVSGLSWITDISSLLQLGLEPILCDCNIKDLSLDLHHLELLFKKENPSAVILVSVLGLVPDMDKIMELCHKYNVLLIEDVCESMNSSYCGKKLGTFGDVSVFSTYFGHTISTIEGGFVCTKDKELYNVLLSCRNHGWDRDFDDNEKQELKIKYDVDDFNQIYTFYYPGFNLRSTDLQAFLGLVQLDKLDDYVSKRFKNFKRYRDNLKEVNELDIILREYDIVSNMGFPVVSFYRKNLIELFRNNNVEIRPLIAGNMVMQPFWKDKSIYLENCDMIHYYGFYLPNHQNLTFDEIDFICNLILNNGLDSRQ